MSTLNVNRIVDASGGVLSPISSVHKNRIINGAMTIDQRNAGASVTPTTVQYTLDRWAAIVSITSKFSVQQDAGAVTPPVGFNDYLGCTSLSAYSVGAAETFGIGQSIEGFNVADLGWGTANAKTITVSFWVRSSLTGTFGGSLRNSVLDRSYPYTYTISSANIWEYKTVTIAGDTTGTWNTTNGTGIQLIFGLGSGSTRSGTAGAWSGSNFTNATGATSVVGTNGATFYITGVQLEKGTQATSFEYRQYGQEFALCQRYFWINRSDGTATGFNSIGSGHSNSTSSALLHIENPVAMRTSPTFAYNGTVTISSGVNSPTLNTVAAFYGGSVSGMLNVTLNSAVTQGYGAIAYLNNATTNYITLSAEL